MNRAFRAAALTALVDAARRARLASHDPRHRRSGGSDGARRLRARRESEPSARAGPPSPPRAYRDHRSRRHPAVRRARRDRVACSRITASPTRRKWRCGPATSDASALHADGPTAASPRPEAGWRLAATGRWSRSIRAWALHMAVNARRRRGSPKVGGIASRTHPLAAPSRPIPVSRLGVLRRASQRHARTRHAGRHGHPARDIFAPDARDDGAVAVDHLRR